MNNSIQSMTGFGAAEMIGNQYIVTIEIKSVNNRFKDIRFKMSSQFNKFEMNWRQKMEAYFKRGTVDVNISYQKKPGAGMDLQVDYKKIRSFLQETQKELGDKIQFNIDPTSFLRNEFSLDQATVDELGDLANKGLDKALDELKKSRSIEGEKLIIKIKEHFSEYKNKLLNCQSLAKNNPEILKNKLNQKLKEKLADVKIDESRLLQEVIYYLEKLEVDEEINRALIHLKKCEQLFTEGGEVGRKLDFLLQELGRETNTLGSKTNSSEVSHDVVEMKVQLERIREQALNLE